MNPLDFINNNYISLFAKTNIPCEIIVAGDKRLTVKGKFMGIKQCDDDELTSMAGFIFNIPIYKLLVMQTNTSDGRILPVWINTLMIDKIEDIVFM